jgi:hypothetical protein
MTIHSEELNEELLALKGEVSYIAAFLGTFVSHTEKAARATAEKFKNIGKPIAIYRIEVLDVVPGDPPEAAAPELKNA